jgi:ABC-type transporter Mla subunit MlaD
VNLNKLINAAQVEQLNQAAELLNQRITSLQQEKNQLQEQLNAAGAGDPQIEPLQQRIAEAEAATAAAQQQLAEVQAQYNNERQVLVQQFETAQSAVTQFVQRSRDNLAAALGRIEAMNQLLEGGQAAAFGFVLAYGKRQSSVPNRNLYYGRQYPTMPNMFGKDFLEDGFSDYSGGDSDDDDDE